MLRSLLLSLFAITLFTALSSVSFAGFEGQNQSVSLKLFNKINCLTGLSCTKVKDKFQIAVSGVGILRSPILATATTLNSSQCGRTFYNSGAIQIVLPDAALVIGCRYTFVTLNATNFDVDVDAADQIVGLTDALGDKIRNLTIGNSVTLEAVTASQWFAHSIYGTWTDAN